MVFVYLLRRYGLLSQGNSLNLKPKEASIFQTLLTFDTADCADGRDRVYAIKDLSKNGPQIIVDYNKDVRDTYFDLMKTFALNIPYDIDFPYNRQFSYIRKETASRCEDMVRMLACASCKKTDGNEMESWIPDWRVKNRFESELHQKTVERMVKTGSDDIIARIPHAPLVARTGYHYLCIRGTLLRSLNTSQSISPTIDESHRKEYLEMSQWVDKFLKSSLAQGANHYRRNDCIWLPNAEVDGLFSTLAFALEKGRSAPVFEGREIYRIHSCFEIKTPEPGYMVALERSKPEFQQSLASAGFSFDQEFCLE